MATQLQGLLKEAAYYSVSSVVGRLFNVLLLPLYTAVMPPQDGEYGMMTSLYGWASLITVILSMGLETTFMRIANKDEEKINPARVYSTAFITILLLVVASGTFIYHFSPEIAAFLGYPSHIIEVKLMDAVICGDVLLVLPFCYLRYRHYVTKYAICKALYATVNAALCFAVLYLCPILQERWPDGMLWEFYLPHNSLCYILGCNLTTCLILLYILIDEWKPFGHFHSAWNQTYEFGYVFDRRIFKEMMVYALPILGASLIDIGIQTIDRILYLWLIPGTEGMRQLGIYGACFRIGMIMALATQVLRDISEPAIFRLARSHRVVENIGALIIKYFVICSIIIFLSVETCMGFIEQNLLANSEYREGVHIIPILMWSEMFVGMQFYMSFWYKLTDRPSYGTVFAAITLVVIIAINLIFVPRYGYTACAWAIFAGCVVRLLLTILVSRKNRQYEFHFHGYRYVTLGLIIYLSMMLCPEELGEFWTFIYKLCCLLTYLALFLTFEHKDLKAVYERINRRRKTRHRFVINDNNNNNILD